MKLKTRAILYASSLKQLCRTLLMKLWHFICPHSTNLNSSLDMSVNLSFIGGAGWQFFTDNGAILSGGMIYTYAAGGTTPLATYTDRTGATPNANPIILDAAGRTPSQVWSTEGLLYKYVVKTSTNTTIRSWDNIGGSVVASDLAQDLASSAADKGSSLVGYLPAGTGAVTTTVQSKLRESVSVKDFGAVGDGVHDDTVAFDSAVVFACLNGITLYVPDGSYKLVQNSRTMTGKGYASHVFSVYKAVEISMSEGATLYFNGGFKGFLFISHNSNQEDKTLQVRINGGIVDGTDNGEYQSVTGGNPIIWAFVGYYLNYFEIKSSTVQNLYASAGYSSYYGRFFVCENNRIINVWANSYFYANNDNCGDGVYCARTVKYAINNNYIYNDLTISTALYGRCGIVLEYENTINGDVNNNSISGYDRGIHVELIDGSATISNNYIIRCPSGIVLWANNGHPQYILNNYINNYDAIHGKGNSLYTQQSIVMLQANTNNGTVIANNTIIVEGGPLYIQPQFIITITSSNVIFENNTIIDHSISIPFIYGQGFSLTDIVSDIIIRNNNFAYVGVVGSSNAVHTIFENNYVNGLGFGTGTASTKTTLPSQFWRYGDGLVSTNQAIVRGNTFTAQYANKCPINCYGAYSFTNNIVMKPQISGYLFENGIAAEWGDAFAEVSGNTIYTDDTSSWSQNADNFFKFTDKRGISSIYPNQVINTVNAAYTQYFSGIGNIPHSGVNIQLPSSASVATGTFLAGDIYYNNAPTSGGYIGGICTVAGSPGTWKTFGLIS